MKLDDTERALIRTSWAAAAADPAMAAQLFYGRLFRVRPDLRALFGEDMRLQGRKLTDTINFVVDNIDYPETLQEPVRALGERHLGYGASADDYNDVGSALIWTFGQLLGAGFSDAMRDAWLKVYTDLAQEMTQVA